MLERGGNNTWAPDVIEIDDRFFVSYAAPGQQPKAAIGLVELDPASGQRQYPERAPTNIAINSEASIIIYRDGWYYLLVTHGSCCRGASSTYNIRMGRSRDVTGPGRGGSGGVIPDQDVGAAATN